MALLLYCFTVLLFVFYRLKIIDFRWNMDDDFRPPILYHADHWDIPVPEDREGRLKKPFNRFLKACSGVKTSPTYSVWDVYFIASGKAVLYWQDPHAGCMYYWLYFFDCINYTTLFWNVYFMSNIFFQDDENIPGWHYITSACLCTVNYKLKCTQMQLHLTNVFTNCNPAVITFGTESLWL